jgi:hypothetical protein
MAIPGRRTGNTSIIDADTNPQVFSRIRSTFRGEDSSKTEEPKKVYAMVRIQGMMADRVT